MKLRNKNLIKCVRFYLIGILIILSGHAQSAELIKGLGGNSDYGQLAMGRNDDGSSAAIDITPSFPNGINFFGNIYTTLYINNNGNVTFNGRLSTYTPQPFPVANRPMIAPYWGDVDTRGSISDQPYWNNVYYAFPDDQTMIITWHKVGYYSARTNKLNDFQLVLRRRSETGVGNIDAEFRYNQLEWTTGNASGGSNGLGGIPAQIGFDAGDRINYYAHPDSQTAEILNLVNTTNVNEVGVWRFLLREGEITEPEDTLRDVVAQLFIPASTVTVDAASYSTVPMSDEVSGDTRILTWNYDTISAGEIKDLSFDLDLVNPTAGANEVIAYRFELDYIDVNDQPVHTELGEYSVEVASSRLDIELSTDKTVYSANTDVIFTSTMNNLGEVNAEATWNIYIKDFQGVLIDTIPLVNVNGLLTQSTTIQQSYWNANDYIAGEYTAELVAIDSIVNSTLVAAQQFEITPSDSSGNDQLVLAILGSTDRPEYHTTDTVESQISLVNESVNITFNNATLNIALIDPNGYEIGSQSQDLYNLVPGGINQRKQLWNLDKSDEGNYQLLATILDDSNQTILSNSISFSVKEDTTRSVIGTIGAVNSSWVLGEQPQCNFEINNSGTLPIDSLDYRTSLVRLSSEEVIITDTSLDSLLPAASITDTRNYEADLFTVDHYACVLEQKVEETYQLLDSALFEILPPPIEVDMTLDATTFGRLLVLTDETRECSALEDIHVELDWEKELSVSDQVVVRIYNENNILLETETINAFDMILNSQHPVNDADSAVSVTSSGLIQVTLSAPIHKLGDRYRVEVEAKTGWFVRTTKDWSFSTDCDRPLTIGEVVEDVHLLGFKLFSGSSDSVKDLDPYGPSNAPNVSEQNEFLKTQLMHEGIEYTLVHTAENFTQEMRSGDYAAYVVLSERPHLSLVAQKELREHIFDGSGLVVAGAHDKRNLFIETALGLIVTGKHPWATGLVDNVNGNAVFPYQDWVQTFLLLGSTQASEYTLSHDQLEDDWQNFLATLPLASEIEDYKRRAVATHQYGNGKSVFFGYDALAMATSLGEDHVVTNDFMSKIKSVLRDNSVPTATKEQAFTLTVSNRGTPVSGVLMLNLPAGVELVGTHDFTGSEGLWQIELNLAEGETRELNLYTKLPAVNGTYDLSATFNASSEYGTAKLFQVATSVDIESRRSYADLIETAKDVKHMYWYEPHFYLLYADLVLVREAIEKEEWYKAQILLLAASNILLIDQREMVLELREAIAEQVRIIGKNI